MYAPPLARDELFAHLVDESELYSAVIAEADWSLPIAPCPGWTLEGLTRHMGEVQRWATAVVQSGERVSIDDPGPKDLGELAAWFDDGSRKLIDTLESIDLDSPGWTFQGHTPREFWLRRQAQEIFVHRIDAESAAGISSPCSAELAADGINEVFEVMLPRMIVRKDTPGLAIQPVAPVGLTATDTGDVWTINLDQTATPGATQVAASIEGTAVDLLLLLWQRKAPSQIATSGDAAALDAIWAGRFTP